jgi:hypothetical protein
MAEAEISPEKTARPWLRHLLVLFVLGLVVLVVMFLAVTYVPRAWAQWLGNRIDGELTTGTAYGLAIGFVFTFVPLLVARQALRRWSWKLRLVALALAVAVALPNLMTLGIVVGQGGGAHAGERILDVDGPGFRTASLVGALGALAVFLLLVGWGVMRVRNRRRVESLKARDQEE